MKVFNFLERLQRFVISEERLLKALTALATKSYKSNVFTLCCIAIEAHVTRLLTRHQKLRMAIE